MLASPYPGLDSPIVASAWGKQLRLEDADSPDLEGFVRAYRQGAADPRAWRRLHRRDGRNRLAWVGFTRAPAPLCRKGPAVMRYRNVAYALLLVLAIAVAAGAVFLWASSRPPQRGLRRRWASPAT